MPEKIHAPKRQGSLTWADDATDADRECGKRRTVPRTTCGGCRRTVVLHCDECKIQITGCLCTLLERMEPIEAYRMRAAQVGQTQAQAEFAAMGHEMLWLPGLPD